MRTCCLLTILLIFLNVSCSKEGDDIDNFTDNSQELLIQALQIDLSIQDIKQTSDSYEIYFSDKSIVTFIRRKNSFYTTIGSGNSWFINDVNTHIQAVPTLVNSKSELQSIDVDNGGNWSINEKSTRVWASMPSNIPEVPVVKNIIQTTHFIYFYFTDKTMLRFVNLKNNNFPDRKKQKLPSHPKALKILCIGNSFTDDATVYLPIIVKSAGIKNVRIGRLISGGASLKRFYDGYLKNASQCIYQVTDDQMKWSMVSENYSLKQALQYMDWDIITFQQLSYEAGRFQTYQPYLSNLIDIAKNECRNSNLIFVWQMPWAYATGCKEEGFGWYGYDQQKMYKAITNATKVMMNHSEIDIMVPVGTAIQNLRKTSLNNPPLDVTVDNRHLDYGAGRYTAACTLFQTLIAPAYEVKLFDTSFIGPTGNIFVTEKNFKTCQKAAVDACNAPFYVTKPTDII